MQLNPEKIKKITLPIFQKYPSVEIAYLFGSIATQMSGTLSDIDIGIFLIENMPTKDILNVELDLLGELTSSLNTNKIDLTIMNLASNFLNFEIIKRNFPLFVKNEDFRIDLEHHIHSMYLDRRFHETMFNQIFLQQIREKNGYS